MSKKSIKIGVVLSGCGYLDGSEIHESVLTMLAIQKHGAESYCFAPDIPQHHVTNHITKEETGETRNVLVESARIARGKISPLGDFDPTQVDALVFPGGFGAALNLSNFAIESENCTIHEDIAKAILGMVQLKKPIAALCIAPAIMAKLLKGVKLTIGQDPGTAAALEKLGALHGTTSHGEIVIDPNYKLVTSPCYMLDASIPQVAEGADNVIKAILNMIEN